MLGYCHGLGRSSAFLWLACTLWLMGCTRRQDAAPEASGPTAQDASEGRSSQAASGPKVVFLGDSISAGLHLPAEQAFPAVLQRQLNQRGAPFSLVNAGVSGDTSAGGLRRTDWILRQKPAVVVLELGANDGLRGLPPDQVEQNLRAIIEKVRAQGAAVLLLGMRLPPSMGFQHGAAYEQMYARLASDLDVPAVPFFMRGVAGVPELNLEDGLHPSAAGHELLARNVADALEPLVRAAAAAQQSP